MSRWIHALAEARVAHSWVGSASLGRVLICTELRAAGDAGVPVVLSAPASAATRELVAVAGARGRCFLVRRQLGVNPVAQR